MRGAGALRVALSDLLNSGAGTMREGMRSYGDVVAPQVSRRLVPDMVDIRSARAMGDDADFFIWRRGSENKVGRPEPLEARDAWQALPEVEPPNQFSYSDAAPPRAWGQMNPEHHWAARVRDSDRDRLPPEVAFRLFEAIYKQRKRTLSSRAHGTTKLVNLVLRDLKDVYGITLPLREAKRMFRARMTNAQKYGFAEMDTRNAFRVGGDD
jgi:hypothetical protein